MAIKISGCNVIDDNRCLVNIASIDVNTKAAIESAGVGGENYLKLKAGSAFTSGDPVFTPQNQNICVGQGFSPNLPGIAICLCNPNLSQCNCDALTSDKIVTFGCNSNCVALVHYRGPNCCTAFTRFCVSAATISESGIITNRTCVCEGDVCNAAAVIFANPSFNQCTTRTHSTYKDRPYSVESCSGTVSYHVLGFEDTAAISGGSPCVREVWAQVKLCYCTTNQQISIVDICCCIRAPRCGCERDQFYWTTPDKCYTIIERLGSTSCTIHKCCTRYFCLSVLVNDDNMNLVDHACCATMVCGPSGGFKAFMSTNSECTQLWSRNVCNSICGLINTGGIMRNTYGLDRWVMVHLDFDLKCTCDVKNDAFNCRQQKLFAYRPLGHQCYEITCNCICAYCLAATLPSRSLPAMNGLDSAINRQDVGVGVAQNMGTNIDRSFDIGNGVKVLVAAASSHSCCYASYGFTCFCIDASKNLVYLNSQGTCVMCACCCSCCLIYGNFGHDPGGAGGYPMCNGQKCEYYNVEENFLELAIPLCRALCCMVWAMGANSNRQLFGRPQTTFGNVCGLPGCCANHDGSVRGTVWEFNIFSDPTTCFNCCLLFCKASGQPCNGIITTSCAPFIPIQILRRYFSACNQTESGLGSMDIYSSITKASADAYLGLTDRSVFSMEGNTSTYGQSKILTVDTMRADNTFPDNTTRFIGVAQNNASIGETVCVALPGQIDLSQYATRYQCTVGTRTYLCSTGWPCYIGAGVTGNSAFYLGALVATTFYDSDRGCFISMWSAQGL